jgi:hypothetical protein
MTQTKTKQATPPSAEQLRGQMLAGESVTAEQYAAAQQRQAFADLQADIDQERASREAESQRHRDLEDLRAQVATLEVEAVAPILAAIEAHVGTAVGLDRLLDEYAQRARPLRARRRALGFGPDDLTIPSLYAKSTLHHHIDNAIRSKGVKPVPNPFRGK